MPPTIRELVAELKHARGSWTAAAREAIGSSFTLD